jgi:death-on-curing protein
MENGYEISASVDEQVDIILGVASGNVSRERFLDWLRAHTIELI